MPLIKNPLSRFGAPAPAGERCYWCGGWATHYCSACGKWICDAAVCALKSAGEAAKLKILRGE